MEWTTPTRVYLIRHGETEWNQNTPGYCGWSDIALNQKGIQQAEALGKRFAGDPIQAVISSDLIRAQRTAETIAATAGVEVTADPRFRELNYAEWEGKSPEDLRAEDPDRYRAWLENPSEYAPRGGETLDDLLDRSAPAVQEWAERYASQAIVVVSHKTTVRVLVCWAMGVPLNTIRRIHQQNAAINILEITGDQRAVNCVNDTCHLPGDLCSPAI